MLPDSYLKYFLCVCDVGNITETLQKSYLFKEQIVLIDSDASVVVRFVDVNNVWTSHNYLLSH